MSRMSKLLIAALTLTLTLLCVSADQQQQPQQPKQKQQHQPHPPRVYPTRDADDPRAKRDRPLLHKLDGRYSVVHVDHTRSGHFPTSIRPATHERGHAHTRTLAFQAFDTDFELVMTQNTEMFGPEYRETEYHYRGDGSDERLNPSERGVPMTRHRNCFYRGRATETSHAASLAAQANAEDGVGRPHTHNSVAAHTCYGGFTGHVRAYGHSVAVEPAHHHLSADDLHMHRRALSEQHEIHVDDVHPHLVYHVHHLEEGEAACGVGHAATADDRDGSVSSSSTTRHTLSIGSIHAELASSGHHHHLNHLNHHSHNYNHMRTQATSANILELLIVNDKARYDAVGVDANGVSKVWTESVAIINLVIEYYKESSFSPAVQIMLIDQVSWSNGDPYASPLNPDSCSDCSASEIKVQDLLSNWHSWRSVSTNVDTHDNGHLLSGFDFTGGIVGYAGVGVMCANAQTGGVDEARGSASNVFDASVLAHEMGHNWGMNHDDPGTNGCPASGFIMNSLIGSPPTRFSTCSHTYYNTYLTDKIPTCLSNQPVKLWGNTTECGNGFVEAGEQCDCGSKTDCSGIDPCCDAATCQLTSGSTCSNSQACCSNCNIITDTTHVCRSAATTCDSAEMCNGVNATCPIDSTKPVGEECLDSLGGGGTCFSGTCVSHQEQCRRMPTGMYNKCPDSQQLRNNDGNFCDKLWCELPGQNGCSPFVRDGSFILMEDGTFCGVGNVCKQNECVPHVSLNPFSWYAPDYPLCTNCSETSYRTPLCHAGTDTSGPYVQDSNCDPKTKPSTSQLCVNPDAGCKGAATSGGNPDETTLFGYKIRSNALIFMGLAGLVCWGATVVGCYWGLTHGSNESNRRRRKAMWEDDKDGF